jgi:hypothetical protein
MRWVRFRPAQKSQESRQIPGRDGTKQSAECLNWLYFQSEVLSVLKLEDIVSTQ